MIYHNREGVAAKIYWKTLLGKDFIRDRYGEPPKSFLNYGQGGSPCPTIDKQQQEFNFGLSFFKFADVSCLNVLKLYLVAFDFTSRDALYNKTLKRNWKKHTPNNFGRFSSITNMLLFQSLCRFRLRCLQ